MIRKNILKGTEQELVSNTPAAPFWEQSASDSPVFWTISDVFYFLRWPPWNYQCFVTIDECDDVNVRTQVVTSSPASPVRPLSHHVQPNQSDHSTCCSPHGTYQRNSYLYDKPILLELSPRETNNLLSYSRINQHFI
jgi:hypothetical protein